MIKVLLADKQDITRLGLEMLLSKISDVVCEVVNDKRSLIIKLMENEKTVVVLDYTLFDFATADELLIIHERFPKVHFVLFSEELTTGFLHKILFCDSVSVILKYCTISEIQWALQCAINGERFVCNDVTNQLLNEQKHNNKESSLTKTETVILKEIALGKSTKEIAVEKNLSFHTINTHRKNIFRKLSVNNVHEAIKRAIRAGIVDIADYYI